MNYHDTDRAVTLEDLHGEVFEEEALDPRDDRDRHYP